MTNAAVIYADQWGDIIDRPNEDLVEIRWFDTTQAMTGEDFSAFLLHYAGAVEKCGRHGALVDAVQFRMPPHRMNMGWRDANIIPRYNGAGLKKFAFHMPVGMPAIGAAPKPEGPANFPTGYFATRNDALGWLRA